ncbi:MAG: hypothetical protein OXG13_08340 [Gemmatimonadaceae bacterium]|nr:hypothetical protein [Gemmatimonadaceae bacterium]
MHKLVKPQKQSYTGEDAQILAYSRLSEMAFAAAACAGAIGAVGLLGFVAPPLLGAMGVSCFIHSVVWGAGVIGWI